ncbi:MAG TPA: hypothetical protein VF550_12525 [Polyangia bacterium]
MYAIAQTCALTCATSHFFASLALPLVAPSIDRNVTEPFSSNECSKVFLASGPSVKVQRNVFPRIDGQVVHQNA